MSRKQRKHIRGKRGEAFLQIVRGVGFEHLCHVIDETAAGIEAEVVLIVLIFE
jgi:hypothetical protein